MFTLSTRFGATPADSSAAFAATTCSWVADVFFSEPPNVPKAVRLAPTMKMPEYLTNVSNMLLRFVWGLESVLQIGIPPFQICYSLEYNDVNLKNICLLLFVKNATVLIVQQVSKKCLRHKTLVLSYRQITEICFLFFDNIFIYCSSSCGFSKCSQILSRHVIEFGHWTTAIKWCGNKYCILFVLVYLEHDGLWTRLHSVFSIPISKCRY